MMKNLLIIGITTVLFYFSCTDGNTSKENVKESQENMQETSDVLTNLPATYTGFIGTRANDSVMLSLTLEPDQNFSIKKEYFDSGVSDTVDYEKGVWSIDGENIINTTSDNESKLSHKFKILSQAQIRLVDSLGNEFNDGKNYYLTLSDSAAK